MLMEAYQHRCAYACLYIEHVTGAATVDHWAPKSAAPDLAYEWDNYRLACALMNARKHAFDDLVDPFEVTDGMFALAFDLRIRAIPGPNAGDRTEAIARTIARLGLDSEAYDAALSDYLEAYQSGDIKFEYLRRRAPFLASELLRQQKALPADLARAR